MWLNLVNLGPLIKPNGTKIPLGAGELPPIPKRGRNTRGTNERSRTDDAVVADIEYN